MKGTSLRDIARACGVSPALVSLVLNRKADEVGISIETQLKVIQKAEEMNYLPNNLARSLRSGRTNTIGLIVADISNTFYAKIARYIEDIASKNNYNLIICSSDEKADKELALIKLLKERQVDGIIACSTLTDSKAYQKLVQQKFPVVLFDRYFNDLSCSYTAVDNYNGAIMATQHLIECGCKNIHMLTVTPSHINTLQQRRKGFENTMASLYPTNKQPHVHEISFNKLEKETFETIIKLFLKPPKPDGLFVANNMLAIYALMALRNLHVQIPEQLKIVAFDDIELFQFSYVPLTAILQPLQELCEKAFCSLCNQIVNENYDPIQTILPTQLILRNSTNYKHLHSR